MPRLPKELERARAELTTALAEINTNPLVVEQERVETDLARAREHQRESLRFIEVFRDLRKRLESDQGAAPGVVASDLRAFLDNPIKALCERPPKDTRWGPLLAAGRAAVVAGIVPLPEFTRDDVVVLVNKAIVGQEIPRKVAAVQALEARAQELAKNAGLQALLVKRADLTRQMEALHARKSQVIARGDRGSTTWAERKRSIEAISVLGFTIIAFIFVGWFVTSLFYPKVPIEDGGGDYGGGGGTWYLGQCTNETDCIYYRWGENYGVGILTVDAPYSTPHERVDPVPFQATLKVGGTFYSGGEYVTDFVRAPANQSLWLKSPFEYGGQVRNENSVLGFKVPWSDTGNIYIQELLYDPGLDQTWAIVWVDGSSCRVLKFPWI